MRHIVPAQPQRVGTAVAPTGGRENCPGTGGIIRGRMGSGVMSQGERVSRAAAWRVSAPGERLRLGCSELWAE